MAHHDKIWEGKYLYLKNGQQYSEENFIVLREDARSPSHKIESEILSRVSTGEFLKINVEYVLNSQFEPSLVKIHRSLGGNESFETFLINHTERKIDYEHKNKLQTNSIEIMPNGRFQITTPSFATTLLCTLARKVDPVQRTPYSLIVSDNVWNYTKRLYEKSIYLEQMANSMVEIKIGKNELQANLYHMFQFDKSATAKEEGVPFYVSKHFGLPYKAEFADGHSIQIQFLKNTESKYNKMF